MKENIEFGGFLNPGKEKISAHIGFFSKDGLHQIILRENLGSLIFKIKKREVLEIDFKSLTCEEIARIGNELDGTNVSVVRGKSEMHKQPTEVLKIEERKESGKMEEE